MILNINLSVTQTLKQVYALSALRTHLNRNSRKIPLLSPDNRQALEPLAEEAFALTVMRLHPYVADCVLPSDRATDTNTTGQSQQPVSASDTMNVKLSVSDGFSPVLLTPLRRALEAAVSAAILSQALADDDMALSRHYAGEVDAALQAILAFINEPLPADLRLTPGY